MSAFASALKLILEKHYGGQQSDFVQITGLDTGTVSRMLGGKTKPKYETMVKFYEKLPIDQSVPLCIAYLTDCTPPEYRYKVNTMAIDGKANPIKYEFPKMWNLLDNDAKEAFEHLASLSTKNIYVREAIVSMSQIIKRK